jgi:hypothetical protein
MRSEPASRLGAPPPIVAGLLQRHRNNRSAFFGLERSFTLKVSRAEAGGRVGRAVS